MSVHLRSFTFQTRTDPAAVAVKIGPGPGILKQIFTKVTRKLLPAFAVGTALSLGGVASVQAATISVTTTADELYTNGYCSLRQAIQAVNTRTQLDTCLAGNGDNDTIIVPANHYGINLEGNDEDNNQTGDFDIWQSVTIQGAGGVGPDGAPKTFVDAIGNDRVFHIHAGTVTINDLVVTGGHIVTDTPRGCWAGWDNFPVGGGIAHFSNGTTTLNRLHIFGNMADLGNGGIDAAGLCWVESGYLYVNECIMEGNTGGGIGVGAGVQLFVDNSVIRNNTSGGGISQHVNPTKVTITNSTISGNSVGDYGGGIRSYGDLNITGSTISGNAATSEGGGIIHTAGVMNIANSTISGNTASQGGGLFEDGYAYLTNVTITNNTGNGGGVYYRDYLSNGGIVSFGNTIIAGNVDPADIAPDCGGLYSLTSEGYNLIGNLTGCSIVGDTAHDITGNPFLGLLADNGGPTDTHALLAGSPAIDAGDPSNCLALDQRGVERPDGDNEGTGLCDIGAYEYEYVNLDTTPPSASPIQTPLANVNGWNKTDVTVTWNWMDDAGGSGIDSANCTTTSTSSGEGTLPLNATCMDLAGNTGSASYTVKVDKTKPTITAAATTSPNAAGWYNSDVTVHFTCADALSGIPAGTCPADQVLSTEGAAVASTAQTVTDAAGNTSDPSNVVTVAIDKTKPTISAAATTLPNANGWYNSDVTVHFTCADALSGIPAGTCPADQVLSTEGAAVASTAQTVTDAAGNTSDPSNVLTVKIDKTAPTASPNATPAANAYGWRKADAKVTWNWTDSGSGVNTASCTTTSTSSAEGTLMLSASCSDLAGNTGSASYTVKVDKTAPTISITSPLDKAVYTRNSPVAASYKCEDGVSGVLSCIGTLVNDAPIDTSKARKNQKFTVDATDIAGNKSKLTYTYSVN